MTKAADVIDTTAVEGGRKKGKGGLIGGLVAGVVLGGGALYAIWSGVIDPSALLGGGEADHGETHAPGQSGVAFVAMEPIMISLPPGASARHLRFSGQLEVDPIYQAEVTTLQPRVLDTLNTYLRAVEVADLENPASLQRLRAQMLRRVQVVTGEGRVRDLLVTEFILN
jgi:flagellar FliL protein